MKKNKKEESELGRVSAFTNLTKANKKVNYCYSKVIAHLQASLPSSNWREKFYSIWDG